MKVAVFANSHVAMLKHATDEKAPHGWTPTYFAAPARRMEGLHQVGNSSRLKPKDEYLRKYISMTSGGLDDVDLKDYDTFVLMGLTAKLQTAIRIFQKFQPFAYRVSDDARLISEAAFLQALQDAFSITNAARYLNMLSKTGKPLLFVPAPLPSESIAKTEGHEWITTEEGRKALSWLKEMSVQVWFEQAQKHKAKLILQPEDTVGASGLTLDNYADAAPKMQGGDIFEQDNNSHMNKVFGKKMLELISENLK